MEDEMTSPSLWQRGADLEAIGQQIAEAGGELTPEIEAQLDALEGSFDAKAERIYLYAIDCALHAETAKSWQKHYADMAQFWMRKEAGLRAYLLRVMERFDIKRVQTSEARFSRVLGQPKYRWAGDPDTIPDAFRRETLTCALDLDAVKAAVASGQPLPPEVTVTRDFFLR